MDTYTLSLSRSLARSLARSFVVWIQIEFRLEDLHRNIDIRGKLMCAYKGNVAVVFLSSYLILFMSIVEARE